MVISGNASASSLNYSMDSGNVTELSIRNLNGPGTLEEYDRDENLALIEIATLAVIFLVTLLGNGTVLLALWVRRRYAGRKKLSRMYFFILHLSVADLITAFLSVLPQLGWDVTYRFSGGFLLCKLVKYGQTLGPYLSSYVLMATAIDRHQAICYPLTYCSWTSRRSRVMVWLAWATSLAFCIPQVTVFAYQEVAPGVNDCWATFPQPWGERAYVTWYSISVFIIPLTVLIVTYTCICREIWHHSAGGELGAGGRSRLAPVLNQETAKNSNTANGHSTHHGGHGAHLSHVKRVPLISRAKINTVKQTIAVIAMYVICHLPFISAQLWATWDPDAANSAFLNGPIFTILTLLYTLNSCVNPWIYLTFNRELPRLLLRHYTSFHDNSYGVAAGNSASSSGGVESTSVRPFSRSKWSLCNSSRSNKLPNRTPHRPYVAQYTARRWVVTTTT